MGSHLAPSRRFLIIPAHGLHNFRSFLPCNPRTAGARAFQIVLRTSYIGRLRLPPSYIEMATAFSNAVALCA